MVQPDKLARRLSTPLLIFYGLGVTIGAGIFALVGEVLRLAGDQAPLSFLIAGLIGGMTGFSYALLARVFPRAGGEAVFVKNGLGALPARLVGYGVVITAIISSAVIAIAFSGYLSVFVNINSGIIVAGLIIALAGIAAIGVMQSVIFATLITLVELGILVVIAVSGLPTVAENPQAVSDAFVPTNAAAIPGILSAALIAFFAFIGFEDIENMAEETTNPSYTLPRAIFWTLGITILVYLTIALVAVALPDREALLNSSAPMATLFEQVTGRDGQPIAALAAIAMINGILVQIVMAARVLYGMANERLAPKIFGSINQRTKTPLVATFGVSTVIIILALAFDITPLAAATSIVTLSVFALVNLSFALIGRKHDDRLLRRYGPFGYLASGICVALIIYNIQSGTLVAH